jgi:hypothetical protein
MKHTAVGAAFVARTPADMSIVNAAVAVTLGGNGIVSRAVAAIGGASPELVIALELTPLVDNAPDDERITRALELVASGEPVEDYRGGAFPSQMARSSCGGPRQVLERARA